MRSIFTFIFCALSYISWAGTFAVDSIGLEQKDNQEFIVHRVEEGETLYSLSRKYNVPIYEIIKNNPPTEFGLDPGQVIRIPVKQKKVAVEEVKPESVKVEQPTNDNVVVQEQKIVVEQPSETKPAALKTSSQKEIIHTVEPKQTLFSISRMYEVTVDDIKKWNSLTSNSLDIGQQLKIYPDGKSEEYEKSKTVGKTHEVKPSETLYSISRQYDITVDQIKKWNNLTSNEISIDQVLVVGESTVPSMQVQNEVKVVSESKPIDKPKETVKTTEKIDTAKYNIKPERKQLYNEIFETGMAEQIEGSSSNRKYLALHKSAEVGTIIKVRNEMNDMEVFVRVIGTLPNTSVNDNIIIKLSKSAYERLGAIDPKFRVSISYIP